MHFPLFAAALLIQVHPHHQRFTKLARFLDELGDEESPYLFNYIPVEILGTIYERFLGKIVRPQGRGVTIEEKPEVRKAGGVYYTPRYIVEYIVGQTVGKLLAGREPEDAFKLRILDPACGSGSFLIRAFEVVDPEGIDLLPFTAGSHVDVTPPAPSADPQPNPAPRHPRSSSEPPPASAARCGQIPSSAPRCNTC